MTDDEIKELGEHFEDYMKSIGIKDIKNIPIECSIKEECKEVWIIK